MVYCEVHMQTIKVWCSADNWIHYLNDYDITEEIRSNVDELPGQVHK